LEWVYRSDGEALNTHQNFGVKTSWKAANSRIKKYKIKWILRE